MAQDVAAFLPRVRRAIEGPKSPLPNGDPEYLDDTQVTALTADAIADIILLTQGRWLHTLTREDVPPDESWSVDPDLSEPEERLVANQVALNYFYFIFQNAKTSERIANEGQEWEWSRSAQAMVRQMDFVKEQRDAALEALLAENPVLARYASLIAARDVHGYLLVEPWRRFSDDRFTVAGGQEVVVPGP